MPPARVLADTGPLYALVDRSDRLHRRAVNELAELQRAGTVVIVPGPVLGEGHSLCQRRLGLPVASRWLTDILAGASLIAPKTDDYRGAVRRLSRYGDQAITVTDAIVAELSAALSTAVWTFDHHFDVLGCRVWRPT